MVFQQRKKTQSLTQNEEEKTNLTETRKPVERNRLKQTATKTTFNPR